jgi:hypothetical protein
MTVTQESEGDRDGDQAVAVGGDLLVASESMAPWVLSPEASVENPQAAGPPRNQCGGRFWVLAEASSDEEEDHDSPCSDPRRLLRYVSNSNSSNSHLSSAKHLKRDRKRLSQRRWAAKELAVSPSSVRDLPLPSVKADRYSRRRKLPALEPTMFTLDEFDANEWITVYHRRRKSLARASRPLSWPG